MLHHVNVELLTSSFHQLNKHAAPGVDPITWQEYEKDLEESLDDLHGRIHRGAYRALSSRRVHIPKSDGRTRPLVENESEARQCLDALRERLAKFGLPLHPEKTRLIEFGRAASARREREGRGPCETFEFLGFTHICGKTKGNKRFVLWRRTSRKQFTRTLQAIKAKLRKSRSSG